MNIKNVAFPGGGHVVILGAGASIASTLLDKEKNGKKLPSMNDLPTVIPMADITYHRGQAPMIGFKPLLFWAMPDLRRDSGKSERVLLSSRCSFGSKGRGLKRKSQKPTIFFGFWCWTCVFTPEKKI